MPIFQKDKNFFKIIIILPFLNLFLITSCSLKNFKSNSVHFDTTIDEINQFKKLKIPKGINMPDQKQEYKIPFSKKDFAKKNNDLFPPI